jgi:predicted dienelactone hydrolase
VQHLGSDTAIWANLLDGGVQGALQRAVANLHNAINRPLDASFAITRMLELNRDPQSPFFKRLDPQRIGAAGHSFGAFTTLALAGQTFPPYEGKTWFFGDPRVKAAVPISASVPADRRDLEATYGRVRIPCLHITGTLDDSPLGETMAAERRVPFDHCRHSDQYMVTFNGADHMTFAGLSGEEFDTPSNRVFQKWTCVSTTIFWKAYLEDDPRCRAWLARSFPAELGSTGKVEVKLLPASPPNKAVAAGGE